MFPIFLPCFISFDLLFSGGDDPDDEDATESEEETSAPHPKIVSILIKGAQLKSHGGPKKFF
jgi:hypothetical protein